MAVVGTCHYVALAVHTQGTNNTLSIAMLQKHLLSHHRRLANAVVRHGVQHV